MQTSIFFPYFYLPNEIFLRHQYLYSNKLLRIHPSDRKPRDSREVKRFISESGFPEDLILNEEREDVSNRFITMIEKTYTENRDVYIQQLGKYDKERASAKTFHLCRPDIWPKVVQTLLDKGLANMEKSGSWCLSTRKMVMAWTICQTLYFQKDFNVPRCTDDVVYDDLAVLAECLPDGSGDEVIDRAVLEFPYVYPDKILDKSLDQLESIKRQMMSFTETFQPVLLEEIQNIEKLKSMPEVKNQLKDIHFKLKEPLNKISEIMKKNGEKVAWAYGQIRWYLSYDSSLSEFTTFSPVKIKNLSLNKVPVPISQNEKERVQQYPGCFLWTMDSSSSGKGFFQKMANLFGH